MLAAMRMKHLIRRFSTLEKPKKSFASIINPLTPRQMVKAMDEYVIEQHLNTPSHTFAGGQIGEADAEHPRNEDEPENVEHG